MFTDGCVQSIFLHSLGHSDTDVDMTEKGKHNSDTERRMYQGRLYEPCEKHNTKQCSIKAFASDSSALNKHAVKAFSLGPLIYISLKDGATAVGTYASTLCLSSQKSSIAG